VGEGTERKEKKCEHHQHKFLVVPLLSLKQQKSTRIKVKNFRSLRSRNNCVPHFKDYGAVPVNDLLYRRFFGAITQYFYELWYTLTSNTNIFWG
jgi:hypothetical protein